LNPRPAAKAIARCKIVDMRQNSADLFTRLAPVLNVRDVAAEREFYECLGLPVIYEGEEYPDFIAFGTDKVHFGIQPASVENDPPSVLTWQIEVSDIDAAINVCRKAGIEFEIEHNDPVPGWSYRRLLIQTPSGYRLALEEQASPPSKPG
jgi:predicted enzyme related to lactoylglutathione lyase